MNDLGVGGRTIEGVLQSITSVDDVLMAYRQIITRAHERGVRLAVNTWIRRCDTLDGVVDFDSVVQDPLDPTRLRAEFDSGDHLHPNELAQTAMGQAIDLALFPP